MNEMILSHDLTCVTKISVKFSLKYSEFIQIQKEFIQVLVLAIYFFKELGHEFELCPMICI